MRTPCAVDKPTLGQQSSEKGMNGDVAPEHGLSSSIAFCYHEEEGKEGREKHRQRRRGGGFCRHGCRSRRCCNRRCLRQGAMSRQASRSTDGNISEAGVQHGTGEPVQSDTEMELPPTSDKVVQLASQVRLLLLQGTYEFYLLPERSRGRTITGSAVAAT